ncbi:MAG TPA: aspartyl/asparaginyl beta-hydroxylase domain-containing protein, partial [Planctomycetota bacterium]|nr:aspartyl/asparaginyl beta-hydroxylase domain-containing protein [Planctomycetota bacterium]
WSPLVELYEESLLDACLAGAPEMIGVCVAFPEQAAEAPRLLAKLRRRAPGVHLAVGGPLVAAHADAWLADGWIFRWADSVCVGEGERTIVELCEALEGRRDLETVANLARVDSAGVVRRRGTEKTLTPAEYWPLPDFDGYDPSLAFNPAPVWPLMTARGCYWGRCTFCSIGWRENYRAADADPIRRDVVDLVKRYGARWIQLQDSSIPPRSALRLARAVKEEKLEVAWVGGMKPEACFLDPAYCRELAEGGCRSLLMGMESANQTILDRMDKGYRLDDLPRMLRNLRDAGVSTELLWFTGFPGETRGQALETVRWLNARRADYGMSAYVGGYLLHPDTEVYARPADFGVTPGVRENDSVRFATTEGMEGPETERLEAMLARMNNRTLVCNGSHVTLLDANGLDVSGFERPVTLPDEVVAFCTDFDPEPDARPEDLSPRGRQAFFRSDFGFRSRLEAAFPEILAEWRALPRTVRVPWYEDGAAEGLWELAGFYGAGRRVESIRRLAPRTAALLDSVPGIYTAGFSVLGPGTRLPRHCGEDRTLLRCHLALVIPPGSAFEVDGLSRDWIEGETLVFDDTLPHQARNDGDSEKVVLLIDFRAPSRLAQGLRQSPEQLARDRANFAALFPEWHDPADLAVR